MPRGMDACVSSQNVLYSCFFRGVEFDGEEAKARMSVLLI